MSRRRRINVERGSGNVFADLELPDAEHLRIKSDLAIQIARIIDERRITQTKAAEIVGLDQPKVSAIVRGRLDDFSIDRLLTVLAALGHSIEIRIKPASRGRITVRRISTPPAESVHPSVRAR